jgi:hypothetical protein
VKHHYDSLTIPALFETLIENHAKDFYIIDSLEFNRFCIENNDGYKKMLTVGGLTIGIGTLLLVVFFISGVKHINTVTPILLRAVALCLADFYILFN